jgi:hypothetical protein
MAGLKTATAPFNILDLPSGLLCVLKHILWVNNSGDTAIIDPYGRVLKKLSHMQRDILVEVLK